MERIPSNVQEPEEAAWVVAAQAGDRAAFGHLVDRYGGKVYGLVAGLLGAGADADDAAQEIWLAAWRALPRFRGGSRFFTWVYRIAVNRCRDEARRRRIRNWVGLDDIPEPAGRPSWSDDQKDIWTVLERLREAEREPLILREVQGLSYEEAAEAAGCSVGAFKVRLHRARQAFQDAWAWHGQSSPDRQGGADGGRSSPVEG